jgi:regulator of replication initiation timing
LEERESYQVELQKLVQENQRLKSENEELRAQIQVGHGDSFGRKQEI